MFSVLQVCNPHTFLDVNGEKSCSFYPQKSSLEQLNAWVNVKEAVKALQWLVNSVRQQYDFFNSGRLEAREVHQPGRVTSFKPITVSWE